MLKGTIFIFSLITTIAFITHFQTLEAKAAWGDFDTSFGFQGRVVESFNNYYPAETAIQPDDKMIVAGRSNGYLTIVRLLPN